MVVNRTHWTLLQGSGKREYRRNIDFKEDFSSVPQVMVGLSMLDISSGTNNRLSVKPENITHKGFDIVFSTWDDSSVHGVGVNWIGCGSFGTTLGYGISTT